MSTKYKASLIISFYNNIDALRCIFNALTPQYKHNLFEVIIADDGSKEECAEDIKKFKITVQFRLFIFDMMISDLEKPHIKQSGFFNIKSVLDFYRWRLHPSRELR